MKRFLALTGLAISGVLHAEFTEEQLFEYQAAVDEVVQTMTEGPSVIELLDQAALGLPEAAVFVPQPAADRYMRAIGNGADAERVGLVLPTSEDANWLIDISYTRAGFITDADAREWDVDALLDSLVQGTEAGNEDRLARGFPALDISGWVQEPQYDVERKHLIWSIGVRQKGDTDPAAESVNYNTYALGREGYFSLDLITSRDQIAEYAGVATTLLDSLSYHDGKRYADFNPDTDHVAEYGLAALVTGVAAKKLGLFAALAAFFAKFAKVILLGAAVLFVGLKKFLSGRNKQEPGE